MTAQTIIDSTKPLLTGVKIGEDDNTLLTYLNMAKNQIAIDCLLWLDGEAIDILDDTYEYDLSKIPVQMLDVYDEEYNLYKRNHITGYYQTSPKKIKLSKLPETLYVNYYYTPDDFALSDEVVVPHSLINAIHYFIAHKAFEQYKTEKDIMSSREYYGRYNSAVQKYIMQTDSNDVDSLVSIDMIKDKGLV